LKLDLKRLVLSFFVTTGLVPVVHAAASWIAGTSPAMTKAGELVSTQG